MPTDVSAPLFFGGLLICSFVFMAHASNTMANSDKSTNLTKITWKHAVNSKILLQEALESDVDMLEADIALGTVGADTNVIPIMAHPPNNVSDLSLQEFLQKVDDFNTENSEKPKGIKLDFKSLDAFLQSVELVKPIDNNVSR